jgi:hypothetical protein
MEEPNCRIGFSTSTNQPAFTNHRKMRCLIRLRRSQTFVIPVQIETKDRAYSAKVIHFNTETKMFMSHQSIMNKIHGNAVA